MADEHSGSAAQRPGRFKGRRTAQVIYYAVAAAIAAASMWQITHQVFFASTTAEKMPYDSCDQALRALYRSIDEGQRAAQIDDGQADNEAALRRFRASVASAWQWRHAVADMCRGAGQEGLLDAIEQLRYSEEHGVRRQAAELTHQRRHVRDLVATNLGLRQ